MRHKKLLLLLSLAVVTTKSFADVKSISSESDAENKAVEVECVRSKYVNVLHWIESENLWCDTQLKKFCEAKKFKAAVNVCSNKYRRALFKASTEMMFKVEVASLKEENIRQTPVKESRENMIIRLQKELLGIERERLDIERKRVTFQAREIDLIKQR